MWVRAYECFLAITRKRERGRRASRLALDPPCEFDLPGTLFVFRRRMAPRSPAPYRAIRKEVPDPPCEPPPCCSSLRCAAHRCTPRPCCPDDRPNAGVHGWGRLHQHLRQPRLPAVHRSSRLGIRPGQAGTPAPRDTSRPSTRPRPGPAATGACVQCGHRCYVHRRLQPQGWSTCGRASSTAAGWSATQGLFRNDRGG